MGLAAFKTFYSLRYKKTDKNFSQRKQHAKEEIYLSPFKTFHSLRDKKMEQNFS